jgi:hypothetical protein
MNFSVKKLRYPLFAISAGLFVWICAASNRLTFPYPWNDESMFFLPADWWARYGNLSPLNVNAPNGIFWVPDGFTVWMGTALRLFGENIQTARGVCEVTVATSVVIFAFAFRRLTGSGWYGLLPTLLLLTPPIIFASNMVRMEAPISLLLAGAILLHSFNLRVGALSFLILGILFHPAPLFAAMGYAAVCASLMIMRRRNDRPHWSEWILLAIVVALFCAEFIRIADHFELFKAHMAVQANRKLEVSLVSKLKKPQALLLLLGTAATGVTLAYRRRLFGFLKSLDALPVAVMGLGLMLYGVLGGEMSYNIYSLSIGPACVFTYIVTSLLERNQAAIQ